MEERGGGILGRMGGRIRTGKTANDQAVRKNPIGESGSLFVSTSSLGRDLGTKGRGQKSEGI